jgi:hypothetical protein
MQWLKFRVLYENKSPKNQAKASVPFVTDLERNEERSHQRQNAFPRVI